MSGRSDPVFVLTQLYPYTLGVKSPALMLEIITGRQRNEKSGLIAAT